jgi:hypothetical protein
MQPNGDEKEVDERGERHTPADGDAVHRTRHVHGRVTGD